MAQRLLNEEVRILRRSVEPVIVGEQAFRQEFGFPIQDLCLTGQRETALRFYQQWFESNDRPGFYAFGKLSKLTFYKPKAGEKCHLQVFISDPDVRFEFKLRFG